MNAHFRQVVFISSILIFGLVSYGQNAERERQQEPITVLIIPPYDAIAGKGATPMISKFLLQALTNQQEIDLIPFSGSLYKTHWQMIYDKKYLDPILSVLKPDIILMSKIDISEMTDRMSTTSWNLNLRAYNTKTKEQEDLSLTYKKLTGAQIESTLSENQPTLISELLRIFNSSNSSN